MKGGILMKVLLAKLHNLFLFSMLLPFIYGCNSGTGGSSPVGSVGGLFESGPSVTGGSGTIIPPGGEEVVAQLHNPEPATMLLIGGGIAAMGYIKSLRKK